MIRRFRIRRERERPEDFVDSQRDWGQAIGDKPRSNPVTVCIAVICQGPEYSLIVGASDRMLTTDFIEFEPKLSKIHKLTDSIIALIAGDTDVQAEICLRIFHAEPKTVYEAAEMFSAELAKHNRKQAERKILAPIGFTMRSFFEKQVHLSPEFVDDILRKIREERANIQTIICGSDGDKGAFIYRVDDFGRLSFCNSAGFAVIGDGAWHAQSQLMFAKYDPTWQFTSALLLTYVAKRRAEVTPGVGTEGDLFFIGPKGFAFFQPPMVEGLEEAYKLITQAQDMAVEEAHALVVNHCERLAAAFQPAGTSAPIPPPDQGPPQEPPQRPQPPRRKRRKGSK